VSISPTVLARFHRRFSPEASSTEIDVRKRAIRTFTDRLVAQGGFKFRRSAFRGEDPKVTLLAPTSLGFYNEDIPIDFSVNNVTPLYNAALLTECGHMEPRAKELILLTKRWAKDRGLCHHARGRLSPYAWSIATIYYLQVGVAAEGSLLPTLDGFEVSSGLAVKASSEKSPKKEASKSTAKWSPTEGKKKESAGELFKSLVHFYNTEFDWRNEAISVRAGQRAPPNRSLPLHMIVGKDGETTTTPAPNIEDPFEPTRNLGACMTEISFTHLREELRRADEICCRDGSLTELLEPWIPPGRGSTEDVEA